MTRKLIWQSLFFFLVLGSLGTILRLKMAISFLPFLKAEFVMHAHSHIALLGWCNVALAAFVLRFIFSENGINSRTIKIYAILLLIVNLGVFISFTLQGYGPVSHNFSFFSILLSCYFLYLYFKYRKKDTNLRIVTPFFTIGAILYVLAALGLVIVAVHMAAKIGGTGLFNTGVYFYLHSLYNGWMTFVILGSVYTYLLQKGIFLPQKRIKLQWIFLVISFLPSFIPELIGSFDIPFWLIGIGMFGSLFSFIAILSFLRTSLKPMLSIIENSWLRVLYLFSMLALLVKSILLIGGSIPAIAEQTIFNRQVVIGYLHLSLLAFISSYLIFGIYQFFMKNNGRVQIVASLYISATFLMVFTLFLDGLLRWVGIFINSYGINLWLALLSGVIVLAGVILVFDFKKDKSILDL